MAKRKSSTPTQQAPAKLPAVYGRAETNAFLKSEKASILKKFNFEHRSIDRQRDLAVCLVALGRSADALHVLDYAHTSVQFRGSYNVWYAAAAACTVSAYLRRKKRQQARAVRDLERFVEPPCHGLIFQPDVWTAAFIRKHLAEELQRFVAWYDDPKPAAAIEARSRWIATLIFFRELADLGFPKQGKLPLKQLDARIEKALVELAAKLREQ
jgi:hypothetical protein